MAAQKAHVGYARSPSAALRLLSPPGHDVSQYEAHAFPGLAGYGASKHALRAFHHAVAIEERHSPIDFTIVHPTAVETSMLEQEERDDSAAFAFVTEPVSPTFVAETILAAIDDHATEVFMPPDGADDILALGAHPEELRAVFDRAERHGRNVQDRRRSAP